MHYIKKNILKIIIFLFITNFVCLVNQNCIISADYYYTVKIYETQNDENVLLSEQFVEENCSIDFILDDYSDYLAYYLNDGYICFINNDFIITSDISIYLYFYSDTITKSDSFSTNFLDEIKNQLLLTSNFNGYTWTFSTFGNCSIVTSTTFNNIPAYEYGIYNETEIRNNISLYGGTGYGGCGPRAAIGILDYIGSAFDYPELLTDSTDFEQRQNLVKLAVTNIPTTNIFNDEQMTLSTQYTNGFNNIMESLNYGKFIKANNHFYSDSNIVINSINNGIPVTIMSLILTGTNEFKFHWFNVFGYCTYIGVNSEGETLTKVIFLCRSNYHYDKNNDCYLVLEDAFNINIIFANFSLCSLITYDIENTILKLEPTDLDLPCLYNNIENTKDITFDDDLIGEITYLRTGYVNHYDSTNTIVDGHYLVMSCIKTGYDTAYIEYDLSIPAGFSLKYVEVYMSLWGLAEYINSGDYIFSTLCVDYYENGEWCIGDYIQLDLMSTDINNMKNYVIDVENHSKFRIYLNHSNVINSTRNKGRVVVGEMRLYI